MYVVVVVIKNRRGCHIRGNHALVIEKKLPMYMIIYHLTSSLRTPRNINLTIFLGKNAKNRAFLV